MVLIHFTIIGQKDVLKYADKAGIPYCILKDPGSFIDKKFKTFINEGKQL